jgi:membrane protease YdiL (CAAX protease family)
MIKHKRIITFVLLAYSISWTIWLPNLIAHNFAVSWESSRWLQISGGLGPFLAALITTAIYGGKTGLVAYFKDKFLTFPGWKWILVGLGLPVLFFLVAALLLGLFSGNWVNLADLGLNSKLPTANLLVIWMTWCFFYGLGEEGGWRGFLFPEFIKNHKARISTLYVAAIWAPWHLPLFFYDKDFSTMGWFGSLGWLVSLVFGSFLMGWLVKSARFNLWPVILWHGTFNFFTASDQIDPLLPGLISAQVILFVLWLARRYDKNLELTPAGSGPDGPS